MSDVGTIKPPSALSKWLKRAAGNLPELKDEFLRPAMKGFKSGIQRGMKDFALTPKGLTTAGLGALGVYLYKREKKKDA